MSKIRLLACGVLAATLLATSSFAGLTTVSLTGGTNYFNFDPNVWEVRIDNDISNGIRMISYFKWDSTVNFPKYSEELYYTHEHYDLNDSGTASLNDMYSNLPYAKFDIDDDLFSSTFGDEELEVTCVNKTSSAPVYAGSNYFFDTTWRNCIGGRSFKGSVRSQTSLSAIGGEFNEYNTEYKGDVVGAYGYGRSRSFAVDESIADLSRVEVEEKIMVSHDFAEESSIADVEAAQIEAVRAVSSAEELQLMEDALVVVTFCRPISSAELDNLMLTANATLKHCEIRYEDDEGKRITGWADNASDENLLAKLDHLNAIHENVTLSGIVCATILVDLTESNISALSDSDLVYFADLSDTIVRLQEQDYTRELKVQIWDLSWDLEFKD